MSPLMKAARGLSSDTAYMLGAPHIGAMYTGAGIDKYKPTCLTCAICGRAATNVHHIVPRGKTRGITVTVDGREITLRSPLITVCGSGTTGCHGKLHAREIELEWVFFDEACEREWTSLEVWRAYEPGSDDLSILGYWQVRDTQTGRVRRVKHDYERI